MGHMLSRLMIGVKWLRQHLGEAIICLALGLKEGLRWQLLWRGLLLAALLLLFWLVVFVVWRHEIWNVALPIGGIGAAAYLYPLLPNLAPTLGNVGVGGAYILMFVAAVIVLTPVAATVLFVVTFLGLLLLSFRYFSLRSFLPRIKACVERQYGSACVKALSQSTGLSRLQRLQLLLTAVIGTVVCLLLPLMGGLFLLLWIGYLSSRSIAVQVLNEATTGSQALLIIRQARLSLMLIGTSMTLLLLVPFFGLIAPTAMTAAVAHLINRSLERLPNETPI